MSTLRKDETRQDWVVRILPIVGEAARYEDDGRTIRGYCRTLAEVLDGRQDVPPYSHVGVCAAGTCPGHSDCEHGWDEE